MRIDHLSQRKDRRFACPPVSRQYHLGYIHIDLIDKHIDRYKKSINKQILQQGYIQSSESKPGMKTFHGIDDIAYVDN